MVGNVTVEAPCKINLHLRVSGKRNDGYHNLESIFMALRFGDTLDFTILDTDGDCSIHMDGTVPPGENLVFKAVSVFRKYTGFSKSVSVNITKRIPLGAGLGGGSSNAAAALKALNILGNCGLSRAELHNLALDLGSDVPFFIDPGTAFVSGRGEHIEPVEPPDNIRVVLVNPGFSSSTAGAFGLLDTYGPPPAGEASSKGEIIASLNANPRDWPYKNDFLPLFLEYGKDFEKEAYRRIISGLRESGSLFSGLSGTGSTCFGVYKDQGVAEQAVSTLYTSGNFAELTFPLARSGIAVLQY